MRKKLCTKSILVWEKFQYLIIVILLRSSVCKVPDCTRIRIDYGLRLPHRPVVNQSNYPHEMYAGASFSSKTVKNINLRSEQT